MLRIPRCLWTPLTRSYHCSVSSAGGPGPSCHKNAIINCSLDAKSSDPVWQVNSRLGNLSLMGDYFSGKPLLELPSDEKPKKVECPTAKSIDIKKFIVDKPVEVKDPDIIKSEVIDPLKHKAVKKHAIRMLVLRRRKMKKHKLKRLWDRMYLRFRAKRIRLEKTKELHFRGRLAVKVAEARKFDAEKYVDEYLNDYHTPLIPKTYEGKRLPEWLINELLEQDRLHAKEEKLRGKEVTKEEEIIKPGETVKDFIARTWNK